jgi:hypothetical protein
MPRSRADRDPLEVHQPFVPKEPEPDFRREFWQQSPDMRPTEGREPMATVYVCKYLNGRHERPIAPWCPHYDPHDETGHRVRNDWTVQDG